jgi:hypothetical protein
VNKQDKFNTDFENQRSFSVPVEILSWNLHTFNLNYQNLINFVPDILWQNIFLLFCFFVPYNTSSIHDLF